MKLKLRQSDVEISSTGQPAPLSTAGAVLSPAVADTPQTPGSGGGLKLTFKAKPVAEASSAQAGPKTAAASTTVKQKRPYNRKPKPDGDDTTPASRGRKRKADGEGGPTPTKKPKTPGQQKILLNLSQPGARPITDKPGALSLKFRTKADKVPTRLKVKHIAQKPHRPVGVGYDSEDEEAEDDPAIENQFILRMAAGEDSEYLRSAIEEKKIGLSLAEGGADISVTFFDKEGRKGMIVIRGKRYAFCLVDLPCIVEATKSWNKKDWLKSADIHQMLLVTQEVKTEEEAKNVPLPPEVDKETHQYPHGLTPPMHWVRKRRFRKRISHRTIEAVEQEVERLLELDAKAKANAGKTVFEHVDLNQPEEEEEEEEGEQQDETGYELFEGDTAYDADGVDEDLMAAAFEEAMEGDDDGGDEDAEGDADGDIEIEVETPLAETPTIQQAMEDGLTIITSSAAVEQVRVDHDDDGDDDDDDDDDEEEDEEEETEELAEARRQREEDQEAYNELVKELDAAKEVLAGQKNMMLKRRQEAKIESLKRDIEVARAKLGED